jgi:hypothetical protein
MDETKKPVGENGQQAERHKDTISIDLIESHIQEIESELTQQSIFSKYGILSTAKTNDVMKYAATQPIPKMLFDEFWFEHELSILFADTGVGKSLLSVQIGESIASGKKIPGFRLEAQPQPVYYFDFEISAKQFQRRYSDDFTDNYIFSDNFYRGEMNPDSIPDGLTFETYLNQSFERIIQETGAKVFIIDNLTRITSADTDKSRWAKPMMEFLLSLKNKYGLSILALEHTRKRDESRPISLNDLQGSAMKARFIDSGFTIGRSAKDVSFRYIKQLKFRNGESRFDSDNVAVCRIDKKHNFTGFDFIDFGNESEHLRQPSNEDESLLKENVKSLHQSGKSYREIGMALNISHMKVKRIIDKL